MCDAAAAAPGAAANANAAAAAICRADMLIARRCRSAICSATISGRISRQRPRVLMSTTTGVALVGGGVRVELENAGDAAADPLGGVAHIVDVGVVETTDQAKGLLERSSGFVALIFHSRRRCIAGRSTPRPDRARRSGAIFGRRR